MALGTILSLVKNKKAWGLALIFIRQPWYFVPTFWATYTCIRISDTYFGGEHHTNAPANAFRHALWNFLIAKHVFWWNRNLNKSVAWAKKITDYHEEMMPNTHLAKAMDLHNNTIGRRCFRDYKNLSTSDLVMLLLKKTKNAKKVKTINDIAQLNNVLVFIE